MPIKNDSGILIHITSLPNSFGIGDLGPSSHRFIDLLNQNHQSYWQILPINYPDYSASPYSCLSAFAGNPYLLSPETLVKKNYLKQEDIQQIKSKFEELKEMDFDLVKKVKKPLLKEAFNSFMNSDLTDLYDFIEQESYWIHNFALYKVLIDRFDEKWWLWPDVYRDSKKVFELEIEQLAVMLQSTASTLEEELLFQKWLQYEFFQQWEEFKTYAHQKNVKIIGDIPIFVSHRSQDVWSWKEGFQVRSDGSLNSEAGVPPDQFSDAGQKWSMPTYRWENHQQQNFDWWRKRIAKQFEFYDLVRLDHFIGFHHLFNIPPEDDTAKNGKWLPTPGEEMLQHFHQDYAQRHSSQKFEVSPFIAEDLGEITPEVDRLRDLFKIPSMKVFQFGFWSDNPNDHHPDSINENCLYYTGTHDTSTLKGWLDQADSKEKDRIEKYFDCRFTEIDQFDFIKSLLSSNASIKIIPIQDLYFLDETHRFNRPGTEGENWIWRIDEALLYDSPETWEQLKALTGEVHV